MPELQAAKNPAERAAVLEKIVALLSGAQQEQWVKQLVDALAGAAEGGDAAALARLKAWQEQIAKAGGAAAGYAAFRVVTTEYALKLKTPDLKPAEVAKIQTWWRDQLEAFVKAYPQAEDAPEALLRAGRGVRVRRRQGRGSGQDVVRDVGQELRRPPVRGPGRGGRPAAHERGPGVRPERPGGRDRGGVQHDPARGQGGRRLLLGELGPGLGRRLATARRVGEGVRPERGWRW